MDKRECALTVRFGRFLLDSHRRDLLADGVPVPIGSRAFDVLSALVEARGRLVTKDELLTRVWPGRFVEENCLQFHISALRKALGPDRDFIKTIAGRGYSFVADVSMPHKMDVASFGQSGESAAPAGSLAATRDLPGHETQGAVFKDLVAAYQLAARPGGASAGRPDVGAEPCSLADFAKAWIATPGKPPQPELLFPAVMALLGLTEGGQAALESMRMAFVPEQLLLLLSIGALALGRQDHPGRLHERLAA